MAWTLEEFLRREIPKGPGAYECGRCKSAIPGEEHGRYSIGKEPVCGECYFDEFSDHIDAHPVGLPGRARYSSNR